MNLANNEIIFSNNEDDGTMDVSSKSGEYMKETTNESIVNSTENTGKDFIRRIVEEDVKNGRNKGKVITRFPPEPNGFLHIGHAKSICLNFGIADEFKSVCHLRFDDTDPTKEDVRYENSIQEDVHWLGFDWQGKLFHASDYFDKMYEYALQLIQNGKAYVCGLNEEETRQYRGTVTSPGIVSPFASKPISEHLELFKAMRAGKFPDGTYVLRARIDMASPNMKMRDPLLYRIRHAHHYMTKDKWCIYPMYDYAHPISDAIEGITHSICTLEFENNRELYDWTLDNIQADFPARPRQYEFARLDLKYTVMSKRKLLQLVENKYVSGWDDPRLPTISGLRRRGCTPESIRKFCELIGVAKANSSVEVSQLEFCIRDDLNTKAPRVMAVFHPLKVIIDNYPVDQVESLEAPYWPHDVPKEGSRVVPFSREIYIEQDDFLENPPKDFFRLSPGREVRLRYGYCITCTRVEKDATGKVIALHCTYDPETLGESPKGRKVKGTIHWVSSDAIQAEVRLYDHLLLEESPGGDGDFLSCLNSHSLEVLKECLLEPSLAQAKAGDRYQFERQGYFFVDPIDSKPSKPVFNRIVSLKDSWTKKSAEEPVAEKVIEKKTVAKEPKTTPQVARVGVVTLSPEQQARSLRYQKEYQLSEEDTLLLVQNGALADFFDQSLTFHHNPKALTNWINNDLLALLKERPLKELSFGPQELAELIALLDQGIISSKTGKDVFALMIEHGENPQKIIDREGLSQISDPSELERVIERVVSSNPKNVELYRAGNERLFGFFVGQIMKETNGRANAELVNQLLKKRLVV